MNVRTRQSDSWSVAIVVSVSVSFGLSQGRLRHVDHGYQEGRGYDAIASARPRLDRNYSGQCPSPLGVAARCRGKCDNYC